MPAAAGSGESASARRRDSARLIGGTLCDLRKSDLQVRQGERHGPIWCLTVTLGRGRTTGGIIPEEKVAEVRSWIENYDTVKGHLEKISEINRELLRSKRAKQRKHKRKG